MRSIARHEIVYFQLKDQRTNPKLDGLFHTDVILSGFRLASITKQNPNERVLFIRTPTSLVDLVAWSFSLLPIGGFPKLGCQRLLNSSVDRATREQSAWHRSANKSTYQTVCL